MNINLKTNWQLYLFGILSLLLVISVYTAVYFYNKANQPATVIAAQKILQHPGVTVIDTFRDIKKNKHSEIGANTNQVQKSALKDSAVKRDSVIQKVDEELNLADATHLMEVTQENMQLRASVIRLKKDSANSALLAYADKAISFTYNPSDSTVQNMLINLHLNQVKYSKQKLFTSTPIYDFWADDPRVTFSGFTHFTVAIPPPIFGLTEATRLTYDVYSGRVIPSEELDFRVNKIHFTGREYYNITHHRFQPQVSLSYQQPIF